MTDQPMQPLTRTDWAKHTASVFRAEGMDDYLAWLVATKQPTSDSPETPEELATLLDIDIENVEVTL